MLLYHNQNDSLSGGVVVVGYVDLQVNGYLGVDFSAPSLTTESFNRTVGALSEAGTAMFLPTTISIPLDVLRANLTTMARSLRDPQINQSVLGFHTEGPFLSPRAGERGAHAESNLLEPSVDVFQRIFDWSDGQMRLITVSPGLRNVEAVISKAVSLGVAVSIGHHNASREEITRAVDAGARFHTHFGNGIANTIARTENALFHVLAEERLSVMIIADGHHLPPSFLETVWKVKGPERIAIVSDQAPVCGLPPGDYHTLGNHARLEPDGRLHNPAADHLVGSAATMSECVAHFDSLGIASPAEIEQISRVNPLRWIGYPRTAGVAGALQPH